MLLAYDDVGPGPVVVLLHGFPLDRTIWAAQTASIGSTYRVIAPDLRGFGQTAAPEGVYSMDVLADDVMELLDALQLVEPVVLGGLSMGGYVALSAVVRYPGRFRGLILMDTRATADSPESARGREELARTVEASGSVKDVIESMLPKLFSPLTRTRHADRMMPVLTAMQKTPTRAVAGALRGMASRPDRTADLPRINIPTLVLVGEDDVLTTPAEARAIASGLPDASLVTIPQAGHMAAVENPEACNEAILAFLSTLG